MSPARTLRASICLLSVAGAVLATVGLVPGVAAAAPTDSVSTPTVAISPTSGGVPGATWTIGVTLQHALAQYDTISLIAPPGTDWYPNNSYYQITDNTTPADSATSVTGVQFGDSGLPIVDFEYDSGSIVTFETTSAMAAGDSIVITADNVRNPPQGTAGTLSVATTTDPDPATSASLSFTAASAVSTPTLAVSPIVAGAERARWQIDFTPAHALEQYQYLTLLGPSGIAWPGNGDYQLIDHTTPADSFTDAASSAAGDKAQLELPGPIAAGDSLSLVITGVRNPQGGPAVAEIFTSTDSKPITTNSVTLADPGSVSNPSVTTSTDSAGATNVTYDVDFTATHAVTAVSNSSAPQIMLSAPPGTIFPNNTGDVTVIDQTSSTSSAPTNSIGWSADGADLSVPIPDSIAAGDSIDVKIQGVTNPAGGSQTMTVATTADEVPASASYSITGTASTGTAVTNLSLVRTTDAADAQYTTEQISFTTTTAIPANPDPTPGADDIVVEAPYGTELASCAHQCNQFPTFSLADSDKAVTNANDWEVIDDGAVFEVYADQAIPAGDTVTLTLYPVVNAPAGNASLTVFTSSDPKPANVSDDSVTPGSLSGTDMTTTSTATGVSGTTYTFDYTTSATGQLDAGVSTVDITLPGDGTFPSCAYGCGGGNPVITFTDHTRSSGSGSAGGAYVYGDTMAVLVPKTIEAGDHVTMSITSVNNPIGSGDVLVYTSSDPQQVSLPLTMTDDQAVTDQHLTVSSSVEDRADAIYTDEFTTSSSGDLEALGSSITLRGTDGIDFTQAQDNPVTFTDFTHPADSTSDVYIRVLDQGSVVSAFPQNVSVPAGDEVALVLRGVTNGAAGTATVYTSTSSDPVRVTSSTTFIVGEQLDGQVTNGSQKVENAYVSACSTTFGCTQTQTDATGAYSLQVDAGSYSVTASPPTSIPGSSPVTKVVTVSGPTSVDFALPPTPTLSPGITITTPSFGTEDSTTAYPVLQWAEPTQITIARNRFPAGGTVVLEQVVVNGTANGTPAYRQINVGGSVAGNPVGQVVGTDGISVTIPPLEPIHGDINISLNYQDYSDSSGSGNSGPPPGLSYTQVLDEQYPSAPPSEGITDPLPAVVTNNAVPGGIEVGAGQVKGTDAAHFAITPLSAYGEPDGTQDCGNNQQLLTQYDGTTGQPSAANQCVAVVEFTPTTTPSKLYYYATLKEPTSSNGDVPVYVSLVGCDQRVAAAAGDESCFQGAGGEVDPDNNGGGGGGGGGGDSDGGGGYVDPSGTVYAHHDGTTVPLAGATVTLASADNPAGPFTAVPNGTAVMSPSNRSNPSTTNGQGAFGWDVIAGSYQVSASDSSDGCTSATSPVETVPPAVTGINLTMDCTGTVTRKTTATKLAASANNVAYGKPVTLTATVSGGTSPTGTVTFKDGKTSLGSGVVADGVARLTLGSLPIGANSITATYAGDAANDSSSSTSVGVKVISLVKVPTVKAPKAVAHGKVATITGTGTAAGVVVLFAHAPGHGSFTKVTRTVANAKGAFTLTRKITRMLTYRIVDAGKDSRTFTVATTPTLTGPHKVKRHKAATLKGVAALGSTVTLDAKSGHKWKVVKRAHSSRKTGAFTFHVVATRTTTYRVVVGPLTSKHLVVRR